MRSEPPTLSGHSLVGFADDFFVVLLRKGVGMGVAVGMTFGGSGIEEDSGAGASLFGTSVVPGNAFCGGLSF